jgi:hypothetical protein
MKDDATPATKGNMRLLKSDLDIVKGELGLMKNDLKILRNDLDRKFKYVNEGIDKVLSILAGMDKRLSGTSDDHEKRIVRLEKAIF